MIPKLYVPYIEPFDSTFPFVYHPLSLETSFWTEWMILFAHTPSMETSEDI